MFRCDRLASSAAWPSGKADDCKSSIPGSNPGAALGSKEKTPADRLMAGGFSLARNRLAKALETDRAKPPNR